MRKQLNIHVIVVIALLVAFISMHLASTQVTAGIYTEPQYVGYLWKFTYSKYLGYVYIVTFNSIAWSPDGSRLAASGKISPTGIGIIAVLTADGKTVWEPKLVAYGVLAIAWSPDGSGIVAGTEYGYIVAFSADTGEVLWQISLAEKTTCGSPHVVSVAWTSNRIIAVTTSASCTVLIISPDGDILWIWSLGDYSDKIRRYGVYRASISPRGTEVALVSDYYITVFSLTQGRVIWENKQCFSKEVYGAEYCSEIYALAWSPDGNRIAVGLSDYSVVVVNASDGRMLWRKKEIFNSEYFQSISWSPDGSKIAVINRYAALVVSLIGDEVLWRYYINSYSIAWSPTGGAVAVGYDYVYLFPAGNYTLLYVNAPYAKTRIVVSDGVNTSSAVAGRGGRVKFYLDPGSYVIRFYLAEVPPNYTVLGSLAELVDLLAENPIEMTLTTDAEVINITAPPAEDFLARALGKLVVRAPPGTAVRFVWGSGDASYRVPQQGVLEVYFVPGVVYSVYAAPPQGKDYAFIGNVTANAGEVLELSIQFTVTQTTAATATAVTTTPISTTVTAAVTPVQSQTTTTPAKTATMAATISSQTPTPATQPATTTAIATPTSAATAVVTTTATTTTTLPGAASTATAEATASERVVQPVSTAIASTAPPISREASTTLTPAPTQPPVIVATAPAHIFSDPYLVIVVAIVAIVAIVAVAVGRHREVIREKERERVERERVLRIAGGGGSAGGRGSSVVREVGALVDKVKYMLREGVEALKSEWQTKCHVLAEELSKLSASLAALIAELEKRGAAPDIANKMREIRKSIDDALKHYAKSGCSTDSEFMHSLGSLGRRIVELHGLISRLESVLG